MTFTRKDRDRFEDLRRKNRVHFAGSVAATEWPPNHRRVFGDIQKLGASKFDDKSIEPQTGFAEEPWKFRVRQFAHELTERAARCFRRNEASWRFACEPLIFARMNADVACPQCRGRLWRSEIETSWGEDNARKAVALKQRQENRRACRCPRSTRQNDIQEAIGLNRIFTHREDETILHSSNLANDLSREQRPDRIYGLRQTRNFEEALYAHAQSELTQGDTLVRDLITVSPLSLDGDPLLFPFLIHEAKCGKTQDDWHSIKLQTAFPIRACLDVQHGLQLASGEECRWRSGPLVWFFMNKGEDWRLCAAYIQPGPCIGGDNDTTEYHILDLWNGCILTKDGALQLLLIIDYIFDWARDTYRQDILTELRTLSKGSNDAISVYPDTDLMSTRELAVSEAPSHPVGENQQGDTTLRSPFHSYDSKFGMVRHAAFIENRFCILLITRDNVQTFLQSTNANIVQSLARAILAQISGRVFSMDVEALDALEEQWTGTTRLSRALGINHARFLTVLTFGTYLNPSWEQVRELYGIAVAEDAFDFVVTGSKLRAGRGKTRKPISRVVDKTALTQTAARFQELMPRETLLAAIKRVQLRLLLPDGSSFTSDHLNLRFALDDGALRTLVHSIYQTFRRGILEPNESFLRVSNRYEQAETGPSNANLSHPFKGLNADLDEDLQVSDTRAVLIRGTAPTTGIQRSKQSNYCIYFVESPQEPPDQPSLAAAIKDTFENFDVYHTTRHNGTCNIRSTLRSSRAPWNLRSVYGIDTSLGGFVGWLENLGSDLPRRQGSPRKSVASGDYLLSRNIRPFRDPRLIGIRWNSEIFLLYKVMTTEFLYWRGVAQERKENGIACCQACASQDLSMSTPECDICHSCFEEICFPTFPRWISDTITGNEPARWTEVEVQHYGSPDRLLDKSDWWHDSLGTDYGDLPPQEQWYKDLSEYPELDNEFMDLGELHRQAKEYHQYMRGQMFRGRKRPRLSNESETEQNWDQRDDLDPNEMQIKDT